MKKEPKISVIIPVHNDSEKVEKCIESLSSQTYPKEKIEVIVIDDGSNDGVESWLPKRFPEVKFFRKESTGPYDSRNKGIEMASGEVIGFIDSDCVADSDWIKEGISELLNEGVFIVTGRVIPGKQFMNKLIGVLEFGEFLSDKSRDVKNFVTCNVIIQKEIFKDHRFPSLVMGGDRLFSWKMHKLGFRIRYDGQMGVFHFPSLEFWSLIKRVKRYGFKTLYLRKIDPSLPGGKLIRLSVLSPVLFSGIRFCIDLKNLLKNSKAMSIKPTRVPIFILFLFLLRLADLVIMEIFFFRKVSYDLAASVR